MSIKRYVNLIILLLLAVFIIFSINGAFMGARRAQAFFNSVPMMIFWGVLLIVLIAGFFIYASLRKRFGLMLIHGGCLLVLAGGVLGSEAGFRFFNRVFEKQSVTRGQMMLHQGQSSNRVVSETEDNISVLPFAVRLEKAFIEYYDEPAIRLHFGDAMYFMISSKVGEKIEIPDGRGTVQVIKAYKNFKMKQVDGQLVSYDSAGPGSNPAYQLAIMLAGGELETLFVFEKFPMHAMTGKIYSAEYVAPQMVKDYKSTLQVVRDGEVVKQATIEVNKPLFYGGFHFYQHTFSYDQLGPVSGIMVASARGVWLVFLGYGMIFIGLLKQFYPKLFMKKCDTKDMKGPLDDN